MIFIILLTLACAFFTASEMAFVACDWITIRKWVNMKRKGAKAAMNALHSLDKLLTTTLVGTNLVIVGLSVTAQSVWKEELSAPIIVLLVGVIIFIFGELFPKFIAARIKENLVLVFAKPYTIIYWILYPLTFVAYQSSKQLLKLFKSAPPTSFRKFTREDLKVTSATTLPLREYNIISRLLDFRDLQAKEIMIPRNKVFASPTNVSIGMLKQIATESGYSNIPIYRGDIDHIVGVVEAKTLLMANNVEDIIKPCYFIDETMTLQEVFEELKDKERFFAIVKGKHGKTLGIITMEDVLEELFGEIEDEYDKI